MLEKTIAHYKNRSIESAEVIERLIDMARELRNVEHRAEKRGLSDEEIAFYDKITSPTDVLPLVSDIRNKKQEYFVCISLNGAGEVVGNRIITVGLVNHSLVHPREVFADVITDRAASVILLHNHPSGTLEPSTQDILMTTQLVEAGAILGIKVLDP